MPPNISRAMVDALLPKGKIWISKVDGGLDLFLDGVAENWEAIRTQLNALAYIRDADLTTYLDDMEREYGLIYDSSLSDSERRARLKNAITDNQGYGTAWDMQAKLRAAGFDNIYVYQNDPPVDVNDYVNILTAIHFGGASYGFGNSNTYFSFAGGELIVNGQIYYNGSRVYYSVPTNDQYWANFFFVGGLATFSDIIEPLNYFGKTVSMFGGSGVAFGINQTLSEITAISLIDIPYSRQEELRRLIVKYKPIHSWGILLVSWI